MNKKQKIQIIILVVLLIIFDQIFKIMNISNIEINKYESNNNISYILISILAIIIIVRYMLNENTFIKMDTRVILAFAIAGALSNIIDRIWLGSVINYIIIPNFTSVNFAYIYITITWIGMAVMLTKYTVNRIKERRNNKTNNQTK